MTEVVMHAENVQNVAITDLDRLAAVGGRTGSGGCGVGSGCAVGGRRGCRGNRAVGGCCAVGGSR